MPGRVEGHAHGGAQSVARVPTADGPERPPADGPGQIRPVSAGRGNVLRPTAGRRPRRRVLPSPEHAYDAPEKEVRSPSGSSANTLRTTMSWNKRRGRRFR
jgi:hypothetical protein